MNLKKFLTFVFFIAISFSNISNSYSIEPDIFVQSTVNRASQALSNQFSKNEKVNKLKNIAKETVDIKGIGFYTLGSHRKNISNDQKEKYIILFEQYFF